jgi:hypothetical protein
MDTHARRTHTVRRQPRALASDEARPHAQIRVSAAARIAACVRMSAVGIAAALRCDYREWEI